MGPLNWFTPQQGRHHFTQTEDMGPLNWFTPQLVEVPLDLGIFLIFISFQYYNNVFISRRVFVEHFKDFGLIYKIKALAYKHSTIVIGNG